MTSTKPALVPPSSFAARMAASADRLRSSGQRAGLAGDHMGEVLDSLADLLAALPELVAELRQPISREDMRRAFVAAMRESLTAHLRSGVRWATVGAIALALALALAVGCGIGWVLRGPPQGERFITTGEQPCVYRPDGWRSCEFTAWIRSR